MQNILNQIVDSRINNFLEIINNNYPNKFKKENIEKEIIYIKQHILWENKNFKQKKKQNTSASATEEATEEATESTTEDATESTTEINKCSGRVWSNYILSRKTLKPLNHINDKFKVDDFIDIDIKDFNSKYIIGVKCKKNKIKNTNTIDNNKYCKLHSKHLIHGDYLELPNKELCYHFIKDGKYL